MTQAKNQRVLASDFERSAAASDRLGSGMDTAILGLVGEVGSLVSALKKKRRDTDGFLGYRDAVLEELGDVLWYVSAVAHRGGTSLSDVLARATTPAQEASSVALGMLAPSRKLDEGAFERALLELAGEAGDLAKRFIGLAYRDNVDALRGDLVKFLRPLGRAAAAAEVSLDEGCTEEHRQDGRPLADRAEAPTITLQGMIVSPLRGKGLPTSPRGGVCVAGGEGKAGRSWILIPRWSEISTQVDEAFHHPLGPPGAPS